MFYRWGIFGVGVGALLVSISGLRQVLAERRRDDPDLGLWDLVTDASQRDEHVTWLLGLLVGGGFMAVVGGFGWTRRTA